MVSKNVPSAAPGGVRRGASGDATRQAILAAAAKRFADGFNAATMRQIAKDAGCSHTAIYLYFADKEALLAELSTAPIERLRSTIARVLAERGRDDGPEDAAARLRAAGLEYIRFGLRHRAVYEVLVEASATRVDSVDAVTPLNRLRLEVFGLLSSALADALGIPGADERVLEFGRILFYLLHGIVSTYDQSPESPDSIRRRLTPTFNTAIQACLAGLRAGIEKEVHQ